MQKFYAYLCMNICNLMMLCWFEGACQTSPGGQKVTGVARQNSVLGVETAHSRLSNGSDLSPLEHSPDGTTEK